MSRRQRTVTAASVSPSVERGLASLAEGNEAALRSMLSVGEDADLTQKMRECMGVNKISAEQLLASYFDASLLAAYCRRLGKSDKGGAATLAERVAREWAKPSFAAPTTGGGEDGASGAPAGKRKAVAAVATEPTKPKPKQKKKKGASEPQADWRTPLFYWRGRVVDEGTKWEGTWVASAEGLPSDADFAASANTFALVAAGDDLLSSWAGGAPSGAARGSFSGSYKLDQGGGLEDFSDHTHAFELVKRAEEPFAIVGARGSTEFGEFVSLGRLDLALDLDAPGGDDAATTRAPRLTLARRYLADDDVRAKLSCAAVVPTLCETEPAAAPREAPWERLPWKCTVDDLQA